MKRDTIQFYGQIQKFESADDGSLMVSGIASTEAVDADGEVVTAEAMRKAIPSYLQSGTVREMHQPIAAGCPISAFVDDDGKTHFTAKIVDKGTIDKIKSGVLKGFSIGGKTLKKVGNKIVEILLRDISVVDLPNNPESFFTLIKFEKSEKPMKKCKHCGDEIKKNADGDGYTDHDCDGIKEEKANMKKFDDLVATVGNLAKAVETLSKQTPPDLTKVLADIGDLKKGISDSQAATLAAERKSIIQKMDSEGRVAFDESGVAIKRDDLEKMDLPMLKFAARNSAVVPLVAKAIYKGVDKPALDPKIKGTDLITKSWEADYGDLNKMLETPIGSNN